MKVYYTIRPAGPRTRKQLLKHYINVSAYLSRWLCYFAFCIFALVAGITRNWGAIAVLVLALIFLGVVFNLFNLRSWLPGWKHSTWFIRIVSLTVYVFAALSLLLTATTRP